MAAQAVVVSVLEGYNGSIIAYGQTGAAAAAHITLPDLHRHRQDAHHHGRREREPGHHPARQRGDLQLH